MKIEINAADAALILRALDHFADHAADRSHALEGKLRDLVEVYPISDKDRRRIAALDRRIGKYDSIVDDLDDLITRLRRAESTSKSALLRQLCEQNGIKVVEIKAATVEPEDLLGFPAVRS